MILIVFFTISNQNKQVSSTASPTLMKTVSSKHGPDAFFLILEDIHKENEY